MRSYSYCGPALLAPRPRTGGPYAGGQAVVGRASVSPPATRFWRKTAARQGRRWASSGRSWFRRGASRRTRGSALAWLALWPASASSASAGGGASRSSSRRWSRSRELANSRPRWAFSAASRRGVEDPLPPLLAGICLLRQDLSDGGQGRVAGVHDGPTDLDSRVQRATARTRTNAWIVPMSAELSSDENVPGDSTRSTRPSTLRRCSYQGALVGHGSDDIP